MIIFFLPLPLFSLPPQEILHPGDWSYDALAILSREQGKVFFADSRITVAEMENYLAQIDVDSLSESALVIYDRLSVYLKSDHWASFRSDVIYGWVDLVVQPELYLKTNELVPWIYNDHSRNPIILLPVGFSIGPWITAGMELNIGQNEYAATLHKNHINIPWDPVPQFDIHFPKRAYVSAGVPIGEASGINFSIGQGDNFFGKTRTGSVIVSEFLERVVYAQASVYSPVFKYTAQVLQYEVNKYHYMHYLQLKPHRTFSVSLAEGVLVNAPLELRFLNPFTIFHSYEGYKTYGNYNEELGNDPMMYDQNGHSRIGSYLGIKLEWQPFRYTRFYGLFVMDVLDPPVKKKNYMGNLYPDAVGFQAGAEFSMPANGGYWEFGVESVYTCPYLYIMWDKGWSFYKEVPELDIMKNPPLRYWTGTPFGPDTIAGVIWAGFRASSGWYGGLSFEITAQGERSGLSVFDWYDDDDSNYRSSNKVNNVTVPPTGIPVFTYTTRARFEYSPAKWLSFAIQPGYRAAVNAGAGPGRIVPNALREEGRIEHSFEFVLSLRFQPLLK